MARPTQAKLDLRALRHNVGVARQLAPHSRMMAVVKANAYGHGAVTIAGALQSVVDALAVACIEEALELRYAGITAPILLLEGVFEAAELATAAQLDLWLTIGNEQQLRWLEEATLPAPLSCWLKVDTGMHRLGVAPENALLFYQRLSASSNADNDIVTYTHFASADDVQSQQTPQQLARVRRPALWLAAQRGQFCRPAGLAPGALRLGAPRLHAVRQLPAAAGSSASAGRFKPVMTLMSAVISLRDVAAGEAVGYGGTWVAQRPSRIATVTIGYGDGYPRHAANGTPVLVNGQRAPLAGRVSMDMITVDVTDLGDVHLGAEVVLWGEGLPLAEVARYADTIGYELTTRMPARTPRVVVNA